MAVIEYLGRGKAMAVPPAGPGEPWTVVVDPYGPARAGGLVTLRCLRDAVPFVAGLAGLTARRAGVYGPPPPGPPGEEAEAQARAVLDDATGPAGGAGPRGADGEEADR